MACAITVAPGACSEAPQNAQFIVHIDTDAPLAVEPGGVLGPNDPRPLFDRLAIEEDAFCSTDCTRVFAVDRSMFANGAMPSFGVWSTSTIFGGESLSVFLFRSADAGPQTIFDSAAAVGGYVELPTLSPQSTPVDVYVQLLVKDVGTLPTITASTTPAPKLATWSLAYPVPCAGQAQTGEVCVPGGPFWAGTLEDVEIAYQRLSVVSPFFLDSTEVTVGQFRQSGLAVTDSTGATTDPGPSSAADADCDYTAQSMGAAADGLALNCISWTLAEKYCEAQGKTLPTNMQLEYAAGALMSQLYPWGLDQPQCGDAVFGRGLTDDLTDSTVCRTAETPPGPAAPKSGARDHVDLPGGSIWDLGGNLREWERDDSSSSCNWGYLADDYWCNDPDGGMGAHYVKYGSWYAQPWESQAAAAGGGAKTTGDAVGFRCARAATQ